MTDFLIDGPQGAPVLLLTHGSGVPMDSIFMNEFSALVAAHGLRVMRFEFAFMAGRRTTGKKPPPPRVEKLLPEFMAALGEVKAPKIYIGGKSLGGRIASMVGQECFDKGLIKGVVCLGYPFHPPKKLDSLRTAHFQDYTCPTLVCQGEKDPFGTRTEIGTYDLPQSMKFNWAPFGNHDLTPPKRSGLSSQDNWQAAANAVGQFMTS